MPLQRQTLPVMLKGLDQLAPKQTGLTGSLDTLLNMYAQESDGSGYEFLPRPGTTAITRQGGSQGGQFGSKLATLGGQLILFSDTAAFRRANDANPWHTLFQGSNFTQFTVSSQATTPIYVEGNSAASSDTAYVNGFTLEASTDPSQQEVNVLVRDSNGAALDAPNTNAIGSGSSLRAGANGGATAVRIAVSGTAAVVFWSEAATGTITACKFDTTTAQFGTPITITASADTTGAFNPIFDVQAVPSLGKIYILWNAVGGTLNMNALTVSTMSVVGPQSYAPKGTSFKTKGFLANNFSTTTLFVAYISTTLGLRVDLIDATNLVAGATNTFDITVTAGDSITGSRTGASTATVFYTVKGTLPFDDVIKTSTGGAVSTYMTGRALASRCTDISGGNLSLPTFLTKYRGVGQCTYFLVDGNRHDMAISMPDVGAADPGNALVGLLSLPNLMTAATSSVYITCGLKSVALTTGPAGLTSNTGAARITFNLGDSTVGRPVELNGALHIPGALPMLFDGATLTEEGFPIAPEQSDPYVLAAGGSMTASSTYSYRYVFEWTDFTGALHQSAPNLLAQQAVLGAGQTQVTHSIPVVLFSRKKLVTVAIYRTVANGNGSEYFRVGSVSFIPIGALTRLSFVDQMSDATLVGQTPLYIDGGVLENISPRACTSMAIHRGRLLVGGIDGDPTAVWFSKDVVPGFGVAFNDGLVSRLNSANDTVTALGSMDAFAAAFTNTTTWTSSDDYPDDTGSGGVLKFIQASSSNGCQAPRLIARTDEGLVCWQAKTTVVNGPASGPWRFSRGSTWEWIGKNAQLDAAAMTNPCAIIAVPGMNQVRIVGQTGTVNGNVMVYESVFGTWANWTYLVSPSGAPTIVDAIVWGSSVVYLDSDGHALLENAALYSDTATAVAHSITLSPFNFAGVSGYQRIYVGQLTGRLLGDIGLGESLLLNIAQVIDGVAMTPKTKTLTPDANGLFGVEFDPGPNGKCSAYQLTISNTAGGGNDSRCAWTLVAITMDVGLKPNRNRLPPAQRAT